MPEKIIAATIAAIISASIAGYSSYWRGYNHGAAAIACQVWGPEPICTYKMYGRDFSIPNKRIEK